MSRIRTLLLVIKVIAVAVYIGGAVAVLALWLSSNFTTLAIGDPRRLALLDQIKFLLVDLLVPALLTAILAGLALFLLRPAAFIRMRWLQVKLISLLILIPAAHFFCRSRMLLMRHATDQATSNNMARQFTLGFTLAAAGSVIIVLIGRFKLRFGQISHR
jgi:uncharacterized membrane protein